MPHLEPAGSLAAAPSRNSAGPAPAVLSHRDAQPDLALPAADPSAPAAQLTVCVGQHSDKGRKPTNQDFYGAYIPDEAQLNSKGIAIALADGISSSDVSHIASETAVKAFLEDYYCTSEAWSVKTSIRRVLAATNSWLYSQTLQNPRCFDSDRGYVCTLSGMILKSSTAHLFHVGDARIYRLHGDSLEQLTRDHRVWVSRETSYLSRALGVDAQIEIDYQTLDLEAGDTFLFATDGVYEYVETAFMAKTIAAHAGDLDHAARLIVTQAAAQDSDDNLTVQIVRIENLPARNAREVQQRAAHLPFPPELDARMVLDAYEIVRPVHTSSRSHVFLARDRDTNETVALKVPASDVRQNPAALERFLLEEWIARRINSPHVVKPRAHAHEQHYLYLVTEYVEGQTLGQWMLDNPEPNLTQVRNIVEQIGKGLRAFHRQEMIHQDLRPENILIDTTGTAKIIDFGAVSVAGIAESQAAENRNHLLGTAQYTAPEYFLGYLGTTQSDVFSLGVIAYQMLTGRLPYGAQVAKTRSPAAQKKLNYRSACDYRRDIPGWVNGALRKALQPDPLKRYEEVSEFLYDLRHPRREFVSETRPPLIERNPVRFWQAVSLILALGLVAALALPA